MTSCQPHSVCIFPGETSGVCDFCGDRIAFSFEREVHSNPFQVAVEEHVDLTKQLPQEFLDNDYLPEALHELMCSDPRGCDPTSTLLFTLLNRMPQNWLHALAGCGLSVALASLHSDLFSVDGQCRLAAKDGASGEEDDALEPGGEVEQGVLEEVCRNLTEAHGQEVSVHALEAQVAQLTDARNRAVAELAALEAKMDAVSRANRAELGQASRLHLSHLDSVRRRDKLAAALRDATAAVVELRFDRLWSGVKQQREEAATVLAKLSQIRESANTDAPLLEASCEQWEQFQTELDRTAHRLLKLKEADEKALSGRRLDDFSCRLAGAELPLRPPAPNFRSIMESLKAKNRTSSGRSLSRCTSGHLSNSLASLSLSSPTPSSSWSPQPGDLGAELFQRLVEMIPDLSQENFSGLLSELGVPVTNGNFDQLLLLMTEKWFQRDAKV